MPSIMNTMKVVVFGASGRVGRRMVEYALDAGHEVTAFVRHPIDLKDHPHAGDFRVEVGSIRERETVTRAMTGQEAVLSALGMPRIDLPSRLLSNAMKAIVAAMRARDVRRIVAVGNGGVLDRRSGGPVFRSPNFPAEYFHVANDHYRALRVLEKTALDWTFACPATMPSGERTDRAKVEADHMPDGEYRVSVEDVAAFCVEELAARKHLRQKVGLTY